MRERPGRIVGEILDAIVEAEIRPGVSTAHLDALAEAHIRKSGATPSFKGYPGINPRRPFPASICISINDEIVHGIPGERTIRAGRVRVRQCGGHRRRLARRRRATSMSASRRPRSPSSST